MDNITELKIGIGTDTSQLYADLDKAEKKIAAFGDKPIKIAVEPKNIKSFVAAIQREVKNQAPIKVNVEPVVGKAKSSNGDTGGGRTKSIPTDTPNIDIGDATNKLEEFKNQIAELRKISTEDIDVQVKTNAVGDVTSGVFTYKNALGEAVSETYKLVDVLDKTGEVASREFSFVGETLSASSAKANKFAEDLRGIENTLNAFANKNADIADQIGLDDLRADFADLKSDTNASVTAIQAFKNALGAAGVKANEIRAAQRAQASEQRQSNQEQTAYQQALKQLQSMSMSGYRQEQEKITDILKKQLDYVNRRITAEQKGGASKQVISALQLEKSTLKTTAQTARLSVYAKDVAAYIRKANSNMSGMQGYARSVTNIFKGIILSQGFYRTLDAVKSTVTEAWELSKALNTAEATFSGMLAGGQETARNLLEVLKQEAINTPFDLENLLSATRLITAYGIKAENTLFVLKGIEQATAASGDPTKMESIARALGQIYTKGKLAADEVRQLTEAGIAVSDILREELGLTQEQLSKNWADLNIDANAAINAIVRGIDKRYGKALDNMAKTTEQKINNMKESFALIAGSLTDPIRRGIDSIIDVITPKIERLYQAIQAVGLGNALKSTLPESVFNGAVSAIDKIVRAAQTIGIVFQQIKPVISAVLSSLSWHGGVIYNVFISVVSVIGLFGQMIGGSTNGVAQLEIGIRRVLGALLAYKAAMLVVGATSKIWGAVSLVLRGVMLAVEGTIVYTGLLAAAMKAAGAAGAAGLVPVIGVVLVIIGLIAALSGSLNSVVDAAKRVGAALKNLGGGTSLGDIFKDTNKDMQKSIDAYNNELTKQNAAYNNELNEEEKKQTSASEGAANATEKAMKGLMSFDEVYKLNESSDSGGGGDSVMPVEVTEMPPVDFGGAFDGVGGLGDDLFKDLNLSELQDALGDLWTELSPMLDEILIYGAKMLMYFKSMQLYSKDMTGESKEQLLQEQAQTGQDKEQLLQEQAQTVQDKEQLLQEVAQTTQDKEQLLQEQAQTGQDKEQLLQEVAQTTQDKEQKLSSSGRVGGVGAGGKATGAALGLINLAQLGTDVKLITDDIKDLRTDGATAGEWLSLFVDGLMAAVDVLGLFAAGKMLFGAGKSVAGKVAGGVGKAATTGAAPSVNLDTNTVDTLNKTTGQLSPKLSSLAKNLGMGLVVIAEVAAAAILITSAIWALGKLLVEVGKAWEPVTENAGTITGAIIAGTMILVGIGGITAALGSVGAGLIGSMGIGVAVLAVTGVAVGLFIAEIWAIGKGLEQIGIAWEPVINNGDTIAKAIGFGTALLIAVGTVTAVLGAATVSSGGALPLAIGLGTAMLVLLAAAFVKFTQSLVSVADELSGNLAPALSRLNAKLPELSGDMKAFTDFMKDFAEQVVAYTKASAVAGLSATIDTIIGWFTRDPFKKLANDINKIYNQALDLNAKLKVANPELQYAYKLLSDYQTFMNDVATIMTNNSNTSLPSQMFVNLKEVGKKLVTGFAEGITSNKGTATNAMKTLGDSVTSAMKTLNGATGGKDLVKDIASGITNNKYLVNDSFKTLLNSMLSTMERFTDRVSSALNTMLSRFANTMKSMSISSSGNVSYRSMSGVDISRLADGGIVQAARGVQLLRKSTMIAPNVEAGEAGAEVVFPLENTGFIKSFADDISKRVNSLSVQQSTQKMNAQIEQARVGIAKSISFTAPSAEEISDAIKSWFTPQMQSLHDVLEQDRVVDITVPNTSNALWRTVLSELKSVNESAGSRGFARA